jgi:hypothetical protein
LDNAEIQKSSTASVSPHCMEQMPLSYLAAVEAGSEKPTVGVFVFSNPPKPGAADVGNPGVTPRFETGCVLVVVPLVAPIFIPPPNIPSNEK